MCVSYGWGKHLTCSFWLNAVVSPRNVIKKLQNCFFSLLLCTFHHFSRNDSKRVCRNYLGTKSTFKAAQKLTPSQFCSENVLNKAIFPKNANFGIRCILFIMFFARDSDIILMVYNGQIKMQCWHHFKFSYVSLWLSNLAQ